MKKALSMLLVLVMLIGMMPMQVFATEGTQETEAVEVVTEPTEALAEETEPSEEKAELSNEEEEMEPSDEETEEEPSEPSEPKEEPEAVHEHGYKAVVADPTCTEQGYTTYTCECGYSYVDDYVNVNAENHTYENGICTGCGATLSPYLQQLPKNIVGCTNLYDSLVPVKGYYTATKYDTSNGAVLSVVIPVESGDRIASSSFGSVSENMGSVNGIRVTYLRGDKIVASLSAGDVYNGYTSNGYITVPDGVDAVCVPWWAPSDRNWLTLSQISKDFAVHVPKTVSAQAPTCVEKGYTAGEICEVCNVSLGEREEIPPTGHSYGGDTCTVCGTVNLLAFLDGKYVSVLGDSISTFNGYSNDATGNTTIGGNGPRYDAGSPDTKPGNYCLLESVDQTWWMHFANRSGMKLLVNNSWAGSQVFGGKTSDGRVIPAAYLDRCVNLHDNTLENNPGNAPIYPDVIFVYLGINDYNFNRSKVGTGAVDYAGLVSGDGTYVTPTTFGEAYGIMLHKMRNAYPNAQIVAMTLLPEDLYSVDKTAWEQHNAYIRGAAEYYDIPVVDLAENCAITWENYSGYMIDKIHPTTAGMKLISDCIEAELIAYYKENPTHTHTYEFTVTAPTCTEQGHTTYTCACGDSYVGDYVDATGHTYKNGICTGCGEEDYDGLDLNGLNVLCLGDSITAGQGLTTETRWTNVLASKYGWNLTNKSQGGISLSSYYYTANGKSDVSIAKKAEILKTMTTKPDVIIVWGGHNDTSYRYSPLGTWDDETTDSFKGALKYIAELADEYAPDATLFVLTPLWTTEAPSTLKVPENTTDNNWMFVDAIYEGAEVYGWIPVNMDLCGITPFTKSGLLLDNIHPNEAGTEKIVAYLSAELASYSETSKKETIIFNASTVSMKPGESTTLKAVQSPRSGTGTMTFTWSSSDSSVATVDASGKITAVAPGTAVITATAPNGISADISVSVVCEHTYEPSVTAPTCTEKGYTTYTCECGDSYVADYVDAEGEHDFTDWYTTKEATYNADGEESRDCTKCSHVEFRSVKLEVVTSGNVGYGTPYTDEVTYTLYIDGTMVISGQGKVYCSDWRGDYQPYKDYRTQVKTLIVEEGITSTSGGCFAHFYNLETVILPSSLPQINNNAFMSSFSSSITSITIPETVTYIGAYSYGFYYGKGGTTFTDIIIENPNVRFVDNKAVFNAGNNLANLTLYSYGANNNVSAYAEKYGCKYVNLEAYKTGVYSGVEYMYYDGVLTLSAAQNDAIIAGEDAPWNTEKNNVQKIVIESGITGISENAFKDYYNLESIEINNEIRFVGDGAFSATESCNRALTLALPRTVKSVGSGIFDGRQNVTLTAYLGSAAAEINAPGVNLDLKKQFKLLLIGNSYSEDASSCGQGMTESQLLNILQAMLGEDAEVTVALLGSGGKGVNWHATQAEQGNSAYSFKIISSNSPTWTTIGSASSYQALTWTDWDVVSLQPYNISASTGIEAVAYPDSTDAKFRDLETASEYMLDYIGTHAPDAEIYCYMHWAQTTGTTLNANLSYYNRLAPHYLGMMQHAGTTTGTKYTSIIPVGLSIQNARTTYLALLAYNTSAYDDGNLNLTTDAQIGLQRDGGHLSFNIGRYIAGLTFAEMIVPQEWRADNYVLPEIRITESVGKLPKEYSVIAQKAVLAAVNGWKNGSSAVTNIDGYTVDPTVTASELLKGISFHVNKNDAPAKQIESAVLAALPVDFAVSKIEIDENAMTAEVTIRFGYTSATVSVSYTISAPAITQQPESVQQEIGKKFAITVKAEGEGLKYQWYVKESGAKAFKISSNKTSSYAYAMQSYMHNRQVYCVITDANGNSVQTETATITRPPQALKILQQPKDAQQEIGQKFSIKPEVQGDGLNYQWYYKEGYMKDFAVSSNKSSAYAYTMQSYMHNRSVYCVITDQYGNQVTTDVATITRPPVELKILNQPSDVYAVKGEKFSIKADVQGDGLTYQWYYKESYQKKFSASSNKTSAYAYSMQSYMNNRSVYCVITDKFGNQVQTEAVTIYLEK